MKFDEIGLNFANIWWNDGCKAVLSSVFTNEEK